MTKIIMHVCMVNLDREKICAPECARNTVCVLIYVLCSYQLTAYHYIGYIYILYVITT